MITKLKTKHYSISRIMFLKPKLITKTIHNNYHDLYIEQMNPPEINYFTLFAIFLISSMIVINVTKRLIVYLLNTAIYFVIIFFFLSSIQEILEGTLLP